MALLYIDSWIKLDKKRTSKTRLQSRTNSSVKGSIKAGIEGAGCPKSSALNRARVNSVDTLYTTKDSHQILSCSKSKQPRRQWRWIRWSSSLLPASCWLLKAAHLSLPRVKQPGGHLPTNPRLLWLGQSTNHRNKLIPNFSLTRSNHRADRHTCSPTRPIPPPKVFTITRTIQILAACPAYLSLAASSPTRKF